LKTKASLSQLALNRKDSYSHTSNHPPRHRATAHRKAGRHHVCSRCGWR